MSIGDKGAVLLPKMLPKRMLLKLAALIEIAIEPKLGQVPEAKLKLNCSNPL
jgi:hypothetical protein